MAFSKITQRFESVSKKVSLVFLDHGFLVGTAFLLGLVIDRKFPKLTVTYYSIVTRAFPKSLMLVGRFGLANFRQRKIEVAKLIWQRGLSGISSKSVRGSAPYFHEYMMLLSKDEQLSVAKSLCTSAKNLEVANWISKLISEFGHFDLISELLLRFPSSEKSYTAKIFPVIELDKIPWTSKTVFEESKPFQFFDPPCFEFPRSTEIRTVQTPEIFLGQVDNVSVLRGYTVIKDEKILAYEPAAHPRHGKVTGTSETVFGIAPQFDHAFLTFSEKKTENLDEAILLSGRCSFNYFHWLIEYLPKFLVLDSQPELKHVPIILDKNLSAQSIEAFRMLAGNRPVYIYDHETILNVKTLHIPSMPTYMTDRFDIPFWQGGAISPKHIFYLRNKIEEAANLLPSTSTPKKIFCSRTKISWRRLINEESIIQKFKLHGYEVIHPETLTFVEQYRLFSQADHIAGPGGAAFANLVFCKPNAKVLGLAADHRKIVPMHANIASVVGAKVTYITGKIVGDRSQFKSEAEYVYSDYYVPEDRVERALDNSKDKFSEQMVSL